MTNKDIFVVSAPSGTGKTTLNQRLVNEHKAEVEISVSLTTRAQRKNEMDGVDYPFVTKEQFQKHVDQGDMLEWANVFGNFYGTSIHEIDRIRKARHRVILEIDVQGWQKAKLRLPGATSVFIIPPSIETLWKRLENRGTDSIEVRWRRLQTARTEIAAGSTYDFFIVNDALDRAYHDLESIIIGGNPGKIAKAAGIQLCEKLLKDFDTSDLLKGLKGKFAGSF